MPILDQLHTGPHSVEVVFKSSPSSPQSRADEMTAIFDTQPDGHKPDVVYLAFNLDHPALAASRYHAPSRP